MRLIGSPIVQPELLAPRKVKSVISTFLAVITVIARKSWRAFRSTETQKRGFGFPHGSMILLSIIDPGAVPRRGRFRVKNVPFDIYSAEAF